MQNPIIKVRRKELRRRSTDAEKRLWDVLKSYRWRRLPFRRQYSVGWYILDFYCPKLQLAIEVDGLIHEHDLIRHNDQVREDWLKAQGIKVLRFTNDMVIDNLSAVVRKLETYIAESPSPDYGGKGI